jgi:ribonuclease P protein component
VFRQGRRRQVGAIVTVVTTGIPGVTRLGLVAGRKVGGAVERNRAKRRIRHAMRAANPPIGLDVVVIASAAVVSAPFDELVRWLEKALSQEAR